MNAVFTPRRVLYLLISAWSPIAGVWAITAQEQSVSAPECTANPANWNWTTNSLGEGPCDVAAHIEASCQDNHFVIPPILATQHYTGPDPSDSQNICECNTVVYCLISACTGCQGAQWTSWSQWSANCATTLNGTLNQSSIPDGMAIPFWAFQGVAPDETWDNATARGIGGFPEANSTSVPDTSQPTIVPSGEINKGALVVGLVGGFLGALLVGSLVWFLLRRRRKARASAGSGKFVPDMSEYSAVPSPYMDSFNSSQLETPHRFYDPDDPSTYPPGFQSRETHRVARDSTLSVKTPGASVYRGLPELD
ncbi:hypothetical protein FA95DRAFT_1414967 [Auriscalpium vulgare]|uniref:Uncharacterized protein n=1 Tax=Auriscalpium vulgare TaxID=40419 RepID=A0ACB8RQE5_9AGAM|nr:hypothetical protein FA95DRAFT_1414967 [Auriscalpium vulgare]